MKLKFTKKSTGPSILCLTKSITNCKHIGIEGISIGSIFCKEDCKHFVSIDDKLNIVDCIHPQFEVIENCLRKN
jgi:hypothetical protein